MKTVTLDFGHVFVSGRMDAAHLVHEFEKFIQVNGDTVIEEAGYRARCQSHDKPVRLYVTVAVTEGE